MKPGGVILTYMSREDWKGKKFLLKIRAIFFNLKLFIGQLIFMVAGTAYGKIKWPGRYYNAIDLYIYIAFGIAFVTIPQWWNIPMMVMFIFVVVAMIRHIPWRRVWRAAQCSHVRLVLEEPNSNHFLHYLVANFGYPKMEIQPWRESRNDGKRFEYRDPVFPTPTEFINPMILYAKDQVGKKYDDLQLISNGLHLIAWIVYPPCWGKEIKVIKALNRKGGREHCTSGFTACLRWGEDNSVPLDILIDNIFFVGYDTAVVPPCLVELSENWRER